MKRYIFIVIFFILIFIPSLSLASLISISPDSGTFSVGNTFNVSVLLDTEGKSINALQVFLSFPPDKLQVVSPSAGASIIDVWTVPPKFNNVAGTVNLEGGIPGGIVVSKGVITTITFRVKSIGGAFVKFFDKSRVFLNDGLATDDLNQSQNAVYQLKLPPPAGPLVFSDTHPDQSIWYQNRVAVLRFPNPTSVEGYSYVLSDEPTTTPDNISEGLRTSVAYNNLSNGVHYFHIRALRDGVWGGVTHFAVRVDVTPPADFPVEILPAKRTTSTQPVIQFITTDASSGLDHYEIKLEPVSYQAVQKYSDDVSFFIETGSPFIPSELALGSYDIFIRAYDKANNYKEVKERLAITTPLFRFIGDRGVMIGNSFIVPWLLVWFIGILLLLVLIFIAYKVWNWRHEIAIIHQEKKLPENIKRELEELKEYRKKYSLKMLIILFVVLSMFSFNSAEAETLELSPPIISAISENISNKDIFYVGGRTDAANQTIIIYLQNLLTGETTSENILPNKNGDWFYRHNVFLPPGDYLLWMQSKRGEVLSPPSSQTAMTVKKTALEFGSNRLSYETIYLFFIIILLLGLGGLIVFILFHTYHGRRKHKEFKEEVKKVEEFVRVGFAMLGRDIAGELAILHKAKSNQTFSDEERQKESELLKDLDDISSRLGREIEYIEKIEEEEQNGRP